MLVKGVPEMKSLPRLMLIDMINSLWPSDAMWQHYIRDNDGSGNGLLPHSTKPSAETMLTYYKLFPKEQISVKIETKYKSSSKKTHL